MCQFSVWMSYIVHVQGILEMPNVREGLTIKTPSPWSLKMTDIDEII